MLIIFHFLIIVGKFYFSSLTENSSCTFLQLQSDSLPGGTNGDSVNQKEGPVTVSEGALMTLNCTYQATYSTSYLFWYVQHLNKAPQLLLKGLTADKKVEHEGFQATLVRSDSSFHLQKRAVQASDSAVYYCALSDTVREGCGGAEHKPRVQMGLWLWAALQGVVVSLSSVLC